MDVITKTSLEALFQRATDPRNKSPDTAAIDAFCAIIKKEPDGAFIAKRLIASKIQSTQEWEALQGLSVLEACMKNCGPSFQSEIGKFRFLNEMIKLVSPKFSGSRTPLAVRNQVLKLMYTWTLNYPEEPKIKEAYDMLKKQGVVNNNLELSSEETKYSTPKKSHPLFQDEEKARLLQKLLHSKNPDDLQAANRLIKTMVKEDERRVEIKSKRVNELETVRNNVRLLSEMLDSYKSNQVSSEEIELIKEIHQSCERLRPNVYRIAADMSDNDEMLSQVLAVSDELGHVLDKYAAVVLGQKVNNYQNTDDSKQVSSLLDFTSPTTESVPQVPKEATNSDILSEPLCVLDLDVGLQLNSNKTSGASNHKIEKINTNLAALDDFFAPLNTQSTPVMSISSVNAPLKAEDVKFIDKTKLPVQEKNSKMKAFEDLDILGETLMQKCKLDSGLSSKSAEKDHGNSLGMEKQQEMSVSLNSTCETSDDDDMMDLSDLPPVAEQCSAPKPAETESAKREVKPLTDVSVTLESIKPSSIPPITVIEEKNGISVNLFIAKDTPREDVTVLVITTVSKNPSPVTNYLFQAVVPKGCKVKLQSPSGSELPAHNPFLPPSAITQIMLIANPNKLDITLKCMISFTVDDETITEMGEVERLPTVT